MSTLLSPVEVFVSSTQEDVSFLAQLETHLSVLQRQGLLALWHNRRIAAGAELAPTLNEHLQSGDLILLLISPDYFASSSHYERELQQALEQHEHRRARVIPILIRPSLWEHSPLS